MKVIANDDKKDVMEEHPLKSLGHSYIKIFCLSRTLNVLKGINETMLHASLNPFLK